MGISTEKTLGDYFSSSREKGYDGIPTLSVTLNDGLINRDDLERKTDTNLSASEHLLVRKGDIAYNMMRMWQGALGLAHKDGIVSPAYIVLRPNEKADSLFAEYLFKTPRLLHYFWAYSYGLTNDRLRLYFKDFKKIHYSLPPLPEQRKIAEILGTWDKAIEKLDKLIESSKTTKKALMQQLLTGKKRLTGFTGVWKAHRFDDILNIEIGGTPSRSKPEYWDVEKKSKNRWLSIADLKGLLIEDTKEYISDLGVQKSNVTLISKGTIVMSFKLTIGRCAILGEDLYTNEAIAALGIKNNQQLNNEYLFQALAVVDFEKEIDQAVKGKTLNKAKLKRLKLLVPSINEQQKIASILSKQDEETSTLGAQRDKLITEKKALMQQLLTGKKRVKVEG